MDVISIAQEINDILDIYDQSDNKQELDQRLKEWRKKLGHDQDQEDDRPYGGVDDVDKEKFKFYKEKAKENGIPYQMFYKRVIRYGWSFRRAVSQPPKRRSIK